MLNRRKPTQLFSLALLFCLINASVSSAQNDPNDVVSDQLSGAGSAIVVEAFYGPGGVLSSAEDPNFTSTSYLVIDHNDGSTPVAFGYRYNDDSNSTSETLLSDVIFGTINNPNDEELYARFSTFVFDGIASTLINGIGYNTDGDADFGDLSDGTTRADFLSANGYLDASSASPAAFSLDIDDSYQESANNSSWVFFDTDINPYLSGTPQWGNIAELGISSTALVDGSFNGFYFDFDFAEIPVDLVGVDGALAFGDLGPGVPETAAIPEPTGLMFLWAGAIAIGLGRKRRINASANC